jgi:hypothetical protein
MSFTSGCSPKNLGFLDFMEDIYDVSVACSTTTYIWGGFTIDVFEGRFLREHSDLDGFTIHMIEVLDDLIASYLQKGYEVTFLEDIHMLQVRKGQWHASFNSLSLDGPIAMWKHIGEKGCVYFPKEWLDASPRNFYGKKVYTSGIRFEYAIKTKQNLLCPDSERRKREKDVAAIRYLEDALVSEKIDTENLHDQIWSHNTYWDHS